MFLPPPPTPGLLTHYSTCLTGAQATQCERNWILDPGSDSNVCSKEGFKGSKLIERAELLQGVLIVKVIQKGRGRKASNSEGKDLW